MAALAVLAAAVVATDRPGDEWALAPLRRPAVPRVPAQFQTWVRNPVDAFVLDKLLGSGLSPSPEADRRTLIRRLTVDLTGLLPTPEETAAFERDQAPTAYENLVDRLLASPRYGERWARHWLDVVHYADSHGHDEDGPRPNAWPYRDYLIRSFNDDKPYTRFVREQIAGDFIYPDDPAAIVATGFLAAGPWDQSGLSGIREDSPDRIVAYYLDRDDMVTTTFSTFAGLTVGCARCHDHKFDPIPQEDYYALQAVFAGINKADRTYDANPAVRRKREQIQRSLALARKWKIALVGYLWARRLDRQLAALPPPSRVYCGSNRLKPDGPPVTPRIVHMLKRGETTRPGPVAVPGAVAAVAGLPCRFKLPDPNDEGRRRAALADWLASPDNPLTWRVIVNRAWHYHFGKGIVDTPNDLGKMGGVPSHPELLDWLAVEFRDGGGSLKKLHQLIVTSSTYRQAVRANPGATGKDTDNRLLWRMNRTRLDAETVRDSVLLLSGRLADTMYGPPVQHFVSKPGVHVTPEADYDKFDVDTPAARRRSVYRYIFRTKPDPLLQALDCPDASQSAPVRATSVGATQALALWNDKFTLRHSEYLAELAAKEPDQLGCVVSRLFGRSPTDTERVDWSAYIDRHGLPNLCRVLFNSSEFLFVD